MVRATNSSGPFQGDALKKESGRGKRGEEQNSSLSYKQLKQISRRIGGRDGFRVVTDNEPFKFSP